MSKYFIFFPFLLSAGETLAQLNGTQLNGTIQSYVELYVRSFIAGKLF